MVIAGIGFAGSYAAVRELALKKGFGNFAYVFPIGIDAGICVLLALDLLLTWIRIPFPLLRQTAWLLTVATIAFNGAAAWPDPLGVGMHAVIPILFVVSVEAARHAIGRIADITADKHMEGVRLTRWLLSPVPTFLLWRRMKLWELRSYEQVIKLEQDRLVYQARLHSRFGRAWRRKAPVESMMPLRLARYGVPLAETAPSGLAAAGIEPVLPPPTPQLEPTTAPGSGTGNSPQQCVGQQPPAQDAQPLSQPEQDQPRHQDSDGNESLLQETRPHTVHDDESLGYDQPIQHVPEHEQEPENPQQYKQQEGHTRPSQPAEIPWFTIPLRSITRSDGQVMQEPARSHEEQEPDQRNQQHNDAPGRRREFGKEHPPTTEPGADTSKHHVIESRPDDPDQMAMGTDTYAANGQPRLHVNATADGRAQAKDVTTSESLALTTVDRYYLAWQELRHRQGREPDSTELSAHLAHQGIVDRNSQPLKPKTLARYLLQFRIYTIWAEHRATDDNPDTDHIVKYLAQHGITAQYNKPIHTSDLERYGAAFERRWQTLITTALPDRPDTDTTSPRYSSPMR
ncbi:DUF2637 domain-containing protein [Streptomyces sp. NPDC096013]|uniref:DUF2637 domain-containing protein n=1 Tax=Streptomyces sp. NPDC096013 TaxID=3366069 RepID=UPI00380074A1